MGSIVVERVEHPDDEFLSALSTLLPQLSANAVVDGRLLAQVVAHPAKRPLKDPPQHVARRAIPA